MKETMKTIAIIFMFAILLGFLFFCGYATGNIQLPSDLTQQAQSAATIYAQVTAEMEAIDIELTKMASEPELTPIPTPSINSQNWIEHFLSNPTCQIPCWENITPNITNIDTAIKIISRIPGVRIISFDEKGAGWYFDNKSDRGGFFVADQRGIVIEIGLQPGYDETLNLGDIVNSYGDPVAVKAIWDCQYVISYRYQGMLVITKIASCASVDIIPATEIYEIVLFSQDNQEYILNIISFNMDELPWEGYKTYDFRDK